ncbi:MAG: AI-2E family transporter [Actinobacteria bacterium]|nr:AI-2E family transporter [Actinomycetota bacterium]
MAASTGADAPAVDLDWRTLGWLGLSVAGLVLLSGLARSIPRTLAAMGVAGVLAVGLNPLVVGLTERLRLSRAGALAVVLGGFTTAVVVVGLVLVPPVSRQARDLTADLPAVLDDLGDLPVVGDRLEEAGVPDRMEAALQELPERLSGKDTPLVRIGRRAADGLLAAVVTLLFAVTLLLDGERLVRAARRLVPASRRLRADRIAHLSYGVVGRYVAGSLLVAGVAGIATLTGGLVLGVPLAPLVALWVMVWNLVPQIGGAVGGIPFVLLGFTRGAATGLACAAFFVVYLQIENNVLGPLLVGQSVKLSPPATMTAALVGVSAGGVVGALLAVPLLGAAKAIYLEVRPVRAESQPDAVPGDLPPDDLPRGDLPPDDEVRVTR